MREDYPSGRRGSCQVPLQEGCPFAVGSKVQVLVSGVDLVAGKVDGQAAGAVDFFADLSLAENGLAIVGLQSGQQIVRFGLDVGGRLLPQVLGEAGQVDIVVVIEPGAPGPGSLDELDVGLKGIKQDSRQGIDLGRHLRMLMPPG